MRGQLATAKPLIGYLSRQAEKTSKAASKPVDEYRSVYAACQAIGPKVGVGVVSDPRSLRWPVR